MPGIVGLVTKMPREQAERELRAMVESIRHESFYETGTWIDESLGVYVGWCADRESFSAGMPLRSERGDVVLIFSGEEFPDPNVIPGLQKGHAFDPSGPSYLVHAAEDDPAFPLSLNGRFHGVLVNRARGEVRLFNDRFGMHRLYYHQAEASFYFAAEAKAILAVRPAERNVDFRGLGELLSCGCVLENRTLFRRIHVLPGASTWELRRGAVANRGSYFSPAEWEQQPLLDSETYYRQLRDVFSRILPRYFGGTPGVGMSLTGGLDTRMIMAWQRQKASSLPCYTFGGPLRQSQDVFVARQVAEICAQSHQVLAVDDSFFRQFSRYADRSVYMTDGCIGLNLTPDLYIYEQARAIAPVRMSGNYGGEVLRRVRAFKPSDLMEGLFAPELAAQVAVAKQTYANAIRVHPLTFAVFRQAPWHHYGVLALEQTQLTLRTPYLDNEFLKTVYRAPAAACTNNDVCLRLIKEGHPDLWRLRTDRGVGGDMGGLHGTIARTSLEASFKAEYAYDYGMPQWAASIDRWLSPLQLSQLFLGRHKHYHFRLWYQRELAGYVRDILLDSRSLTRSHVDRAMVRSVVEGHLARRRNYTTELHKLLTVELIYQQLVERQPFQLSSHEPVAVA
jgi:asparagine synthase (glutamine-hydrolysing)